MCQLGRFIEVIEVPEDEPVVGWRLWIVLESGKLESVFIRSNVWRSPLGFAAAEQCCPRRCGDPAPTATNIRGLHAFKRRFKAWWQSMELGDAYGEAYGRIEMWGRVAVHEDGYRAEFARITKVIAPASKMKKVREYYHDSFPVRLRLIPCSLIPRRS